jgi:hypothetical protein
MSRINFEHLTGTVIDVTQEDIYLGKPYKCDRCPVALALVRTLRLACADAVEVAETRFILFPWDDDPPIYRLPDNAQEFIRLFDTPSRRRYGCPSPFTFTIGKRM